MKLSQGTLQDISGNVMKPTYDRAPCRPGIIHIGPGAFHRAHQAVYTENVMNMLGGNWKIIGISLRSPSIRNALVLQDNLYTVIEKGVQGTQAQIIGAIGEIIYAPENPTKAIEAMAAPDCKIISLTITEKGYYHTPSSGRLNVKHPDVVHDLKNINTPRTAIGYLTAALQMRKSQDVPAPTIMSCDNLSQNGTTLKNLVIEFSRNLDQDLADWIDQHIPFPNTVVDRIVPSITHQNISDLPPEYNYHDTCAVTTEFYSQWVIEDNFASERPAWEEAGALFVQNTKPFEKAKLRLLNGSHSAIAYLGFLAGYDFVHEVMAQKDFKNFIRYLMFEEIIPTLELAEGLNLDTYACALLDRFTNPALYHQTYQIAMDGSQKLPQRILNVMTERCTDNGEGEAFFLIVAAWIRYACAIDETTQPYRVQDPHADKFSHIAEKNGLEAHGLTNDFLDITEIFDSEFTKIPHVHARVSYWLNHLIQQGANSTLKHFLQTK